jgi:hypothetical protein
MTGPSVFDEDDEMMVLAAAIPNVAGTAGATYTSAEQTILNNTVTAVNSVLAALRKANIIAED